MNGRRGLPLVGRLTGLFELAGFSFLAEVFFLEDSYYLGIDIKLKQRMNFIFTDYDHLGFLNHLDNHSYLSFLSVVVERF